MAKTLRAAAFLIIVSFVLLVACSKKPNGPEPLPQNEWTILCYFNGNNSEDEAPDGHSYVIKDVQELEEIGSTDSVHIVVMLGSIKTDGNCKYYHVEKHPDEPQDVISSPVLQDVGKKDMSDPSVLRDFVGYCAQNYPAKHYMLIIGDHGKGWRGLCSDGINGDGSWMTLPELSSALSGYEFNIIWLYSPSMATTEVAFQIKEYAEYLIASQFRFYPDNIMGSVDWLPDLIANPNINLRILGSAIVDGIFNAAQNISPTKYVHWSFIHLSKISQLASDIANLSRDLVDSTGSEWEVVWNAWKSSWLYAYTDSTTADLREFTSWIQAQSVLNPIIINDAKACSVSAREVVLAQRKYAPSSPANGISIHLPWNHEDFDSSNYAPLSFGETGWHSFLSAFIQSFSSSFAGAIDVRSNPTGAAVFLDNADTGNTTNVLIKDVLPGFHSVKAVKPGYAVAIRENVLVRTDQTTVVYFNLVPIPF